MKIRREAGSPALLCGGEGFILGVGACDRWPFRDTAHVNHDFGAFGHELESGDPAERRAPENVGGGGALANQIWSARERGADRVDDSVVVSVRAHGVLARVAAERAINDRGLE